eukprot:205623_1
MDTGDDFSSDCLCSSIMDCNSGISLNICHTTANTSFNGCCLTTQSNSNLSNSSIRVSFWKRPCDSQVLMSSQTDRNNWSRFGSTFLAEFPSALSSINCHNKGNKHNGICMHEINVKTR